MKSMTMNNTLRRRYHSRGVSTKSRRCGDEVEDGQMFVSKTLYRKQERSQRVLYHEDCWDSMFFESEGEKVEEVVSVES